MPRLDEIERLYPSRMEALSRPIERPVLYLKRAAVAASYPLQGIWYFLRNREFWPLFSGRIVPLSIISFLVYFLLFTFTFIPQFAFLAIFHGWGAWVNAVVLVLGEGLVIIQGLFEGFFVDECRVDVFDVGSMSPGKGHRPLGRIANMSQATLINHSFADVVSPHRILFMDAPNGVKMLGKPTTPAVYTPWSLIQMVELVVFLPLNLIPFVGTPAFIIITGARLGKLAHYRWFQLKGYSKDQQKKALRDHAWEYIWFGTVAMILELIPVFSLFFLLTTTAGAAMWAAKIEEEEQRDAVDDLVGPRDFIPPPPYSDVV